MTLMTKHPRIALIHATRVAIDPIEEAARRLWPEAETMTLLEEGLSMDRQKSDDLTLALWDRIIGLAKYAEGAGSDGVLFTCSAFGKAIEDAAESSSIPVMKPNEAMFDAALAHGDRVAMITTFAPAAAGMESEFRDAAAQRGVTAQIIPYFCPGALEAKRAGDDATHDQLIAELASRITEADVIMLGQFSMAGAAEDVRKATGIPILTSPEAAILEIRRRVEATNRGKASCC
ncbi:aspartate/glutamate racemase family protein [uncultured Roseobacter sp.]|uniref:aspartate/glutamate racemase family protein n=1 Tax=uncultured Roseobacter sp. TaxID=114847 RepID=UPI0026072502|nr:aspartate/glutamate racemase family protein [uncultured Roseobacter sp.]